MGHLNLELALFVSRPPPYALSSNGGETMLDVTYIYPWIIASLIYRTNSMLSLQIRYFQFRASSNSWTRVVTNENTLFFTIRFDCLFLLDRTLLVDFTCQNFVSDAHRCSRLYANVPQFNLLSLPSMVWQTNLLMILGCSNW